MDWHMRCLGENRRIGNSHASFHQSLLFVTFLSFVRFADMLYDWTLKGYESETDLFLTKGVLM